jgi:hypothetical protein
MVRIPTDDRPGTPRHAGDNTTAEPPRQSEMIPVPNGMNLSVKYRGTLGLSTLARRDDWVVV